MTDHLLVASRLRRASGLAKPRLEIAFRARLVQPRGRRRLGLHPLLLRYKTRVSTCSPVLNKKMISQPAGGRRADHSLGGAVHATIGCQSKCPDGRWGVAVTRGRLSFAVVPDRFRPHRFADCVGSIEESR